MCANNGYSDGIGEYFITIDTDLCDGCGDCVTACPRDVFEIALDDWDDDKAQVRDSIRRRIADVCWGFDARCAREPVSCHSACPRDAIRHSW